MINASNCLAFALTHKTPTSHTYLLGGTNGLLACCMSLPFGCSQLRDRLTLRRWFVIPKASQDRKPHGYPPCANPELSFDNRLVQNTPIGQLGAVVW